MPSTIDEEPIKRFGQIAGRSATAIAQDLSILKAKDVGVRHREPFVIGVDQILECDGQMFDKPLNIEAASSHLRRLQNRTHRLVTAACVVREDEIAWSIDAVAQLTMRSLTDEEIEAYLAATGPDSLDSVGAYRLEALGANLFERIEGDYFSILGLPLLPLLAFLRQEGLTPL